MTRWHCRRKHPSKPSPWCWANALPQFMTVWVHIQANTDLMGLLCFIMESLFTRATKCMPTESLQEAEEALMTLQQGEDTSDNTYLETSQNYVQRVEHHGGEPGCHKSWVDMLLATFVADTEVPILEEIRECQQHAKSEYLAVLFICKVDPK